MCQCISAVVTLSNRVYPIFSALYCIGDSDLKGRRGFCFPDFPFLHSLVRIATRK